MMMARAATFRLSSTLRCRLREGRAVMAALLPAAPPAAAAAEAEEAEEEAEEEEEEERERLGGARKPTRPLSVALEVSKEGGGGAAHLRVAVLLMLRDMPLLPCSSLALLAPMLRPMLLPLLQPLPQPLPLPLPLPLCSAAGKWQSRLRRTSLLVHRRGAAVAGVNMDHRDLLKAWLASRQVKEDTGWWGLLLDSRANMAACPCCWLAAAEAAAAAAAAATATAALPPSLLHLLSSVLVLALLLALLRRLLSKLLAGVIRAEVAVEVGGAWRPAPAAPAAAAPTSALRAMPTLPLPVRERCSWELSTGGRMGGRGRGRGWHRGRGSELTLLRLSPPLLP